jgi:hypothetical protein
VVGIDNRDGPLALAGSLPLKPDLLINSSRITAEDGSKMTDTLRPDGWEGNSGCDGEWDIISLIPIVLRAQRTLALLILTEQQLSI